MSTSSVISLIILWLLPSLIVAYFGTDRKIGYTNSLLISIIFTPVIGILVVLLSGKVPGESNEVVASNRSIELGLRLMEVSDYQSAIEHFKAAAATDPNSAVAYYNLACAYSKQDQLKDAFHYLKLAVSNGYNNFEKLKADPDLANLVNQSFFKEYEKNGYKHIEPSQSTSITVELEKLCDLKEKGIISEEEFVIMKGKIIG